MHLVRHSIFHPVNRVISDASPVRLSSLALSIPRVIGAASTKRLLAGGRNRLLVAGSIPWSVDIREFLSYLILRKFL